MPGISLGIKRPGREVDSHPCLVARVKIVCGAVPPRTMKTLSIYQVTFFCPHKTEQLTSVSFRKSEANDICGLLIVCRVLSAAGAIRLITSVCVP